MKLIRILFILLVFSITLSACNSVKLADIYAENIVTERAKEVVEMINSQDYDKVNAEIRDDLQDQLTSNKLKDAIGAKLVEAGAFIEYESITTLGQKSKTSGEDYATVVLVGKYEKSTIVFTITMDSNLDIVGLYVK
jgi:histidyl-tRNA synthetase